MKRLLAATASLTLALAGAASGSHVSAAGTVSGGSKCDGWGSGGGGSVGPLIEFVSKCR